jgi:hypothetical protein
VTGRLALLLLAVAVLATPGARGQDSPSVDRAIEVDGPGRVAVRLDRDVYEGAREDLGDLRVVDERGREVPHLIDRAEPSRPAPEVRPEIRDRGWRADGSATAVLDFGGRLRKRRLDLRLSGDNFRRRVAVEGTDEGSSWTTLVDEAWVFAVPGREPFRYEAVDLPENDFARLRLVVHPSADERARPSIEDARVPGDGRRPRLVEIRAARWTEARDAKARETWLTLDLGARHQPFDGIELAVADERFLREVRVTARREAPDGKGPVWWQEIGRGVVHRFERDGKVREHLTVAVSGRERVLRLRVRNLDDQPLTVVGVNVQAPTERLVFEAKAGEAYRLTYGSAAKTAPSYDLARTAGDASAWGEAARPAGLGPVRRVAGAGRREPPWTERHPGLLWGGLLVVVVALGGLTYGALRRAR